MEEISSEDQQQFLKDYYDQQRKACQKEIPIHVQLTEEDSLNYQRCFRNFDQSFQYLLSKFMQYRDMEVKRSQGKKYG